MFRRLLPLYSLFALLAALAAYESLQPAAVPSVTVALAPPPPPPPAPPALPPLADVTVTPTPERAAPPEPAVPDGSPDSPDAGEAEPSVPSYFSGLAVVTGDSRILVGRIPVALFGVRPPPPGAPCGIGMDCDKAARTTLQALLSEGEVSCHLPTPGSGYPALAVCRDHSGRDIGGYLIDEGLALADTSQSYDYYDAQTIARQMRRGRWQFP
jgi:endonuclease YncB( thermonuclease family)